MRKSHLFAVAAIVALMLGVGGWWAVPKTDARAPNGLQIDAIQGKVDAKKLPIQQIDDFSFVFK
jgi:hypothetical protein